MTRTALALTFLLLLTTGQPVDESAITLSTQTGVIVGTLKMPAAVKGRIPVALLIVGSGPTDRDGNSRAIPGKNNGHQMMAEVLAREGVASVRYDKRGIGASRWAAGSGEAALRFDMYVDDAAAWIAQLRADARFSRVIVIGHSEGALIGMLAARQAKADAYVSIAGIAKTMGQVLRDQLRPQIGGMPALWESAEAVLASLEAGKTVDPLPPPIASIPGLASLFRPSVQPYFISSLVYKPSEEIAKLTMPVLLLQGTTDVQVSVDEARALKVAKPDATLVIVEGMNHVMKIAPADRAQNIAAYGNPDLPLAPALVNALTEFVKRVTPAGAGERPLSTAGD